MRVLVALVAVFGLVAASCSSASTTTTAPDDIAAGSSTSLTIPDDTEKGIVSGVVNGDTVEVTIGDTIQTIRLAGIRAPQGSECYAAEANLAVAEVVAGRSIAVVGEAVDGDGVPIRYLIIEEDVPLLVNVELVDLGAAVALHGHELAGDFLRVNDRAYASGRGMWGTFVCGHPEGTVAGDRPQLRIQAISESSVELVNASYTEVAIGGWTLRDAAGLATFTFPAPTLMSAGDVLTLPMTCDEDATGMTWCVESDLWSAGGNTLVLHDELGNVVERKVHEVEVDAP